MRNLNDEIKQFVLDRGQIPPNSNQWQKKKSVKLASVRGLPVQTNKTHMITYIKHYVHFTNNCRPRTESLRSVSSFTNTAKKPRHSSCSCHKRSVLLLLQSMPNVLRTTFRYYLNISFLPCRIAIRQCFISIFNQRPVQRPQNQRNKSHPPLHKLN
jgi:hypothetical protein